MSFLARTSPVARCASIISTVRTRPELVWYVSYGSNIYADRMMCYLAGGTPTGTQHTYPGCRDRRPPRRALGHHLAGGVYFATTSPVWGGGRAFYDPALTGPESIGAAARAYLITLGQFADIIAQEMYRTPGADIDLGAVLATGRTELGPGRYETLLHVGTIDGYPALTFTAPWHAHDVPWTAPSADYLRMLVGGLREAHSWSTHQAAGYLAQLPGARGHWTMATILALYHPVSEAAPDGQPARAELPGAPSGASPGGPAQTASPPPLT